tara:strand:- start:17645 stop:19927 length:2283 start_codon:yes stop_codon:yes gene_type:complete
MPDKEHNLLYINEDKTNLNSFDKDFYRNFNITITTTKSVKDALGILIKNDIHLIIFDCQLAKTSGLEFLEEVKINYPNIQCILLTDLDGIKMFEDSFDSINLWRYILKPYHNTELIEDIKNALVTYQLKIDNDKLLNKLEFREGRYEKMMNTAMDSIVTINDKHEIIEVNIAACELFGYNKKVLIGSPLSMLIPENKRKTHPRLVKLFSNSEQTTKRMGDGDLHRYGLTSSGKKIPIEVSLSKQITEAGNFYSAFIRDVSDRLKRERKINESESRLLEAQRIGKIGHWSLDIQQNDRLHWSDEIYRIFEIEKKLTGLTYQDFLEIIHPNDRDMVNQAYTDSLKTKKPYDITHKIQLKDNRIKHVNEKCITQFDEYGEPIYSIGTVQDITTEIEAEIALKKSEMKFRTFIESLKVTVLVIQDKKICYANTQSEALLEYTKDELLDMAHTKYIHPDYLSLINKNYNNRLKDKGVDSKYDIKIITKSGKLKDVTASVVKIEYEGRFGILISFLDITDKKKQKTKLLKKTTELEQSLKTLEKKNNELEQFAYIASHDLQEPLRTVTSFAELLNLEYRGKLDDDADTYLNFILESTNRMRDLIHGLLEYSILGKGRTVEKVDCNEILKFVLEDFHGVIAAKQGRIESGPLPTLNAYPIELKQLFENLISNALKYNREGVPPIINISSQKQDGTWVFKFKDNGIGINEKFYEKIFVIFKRLHNKQDYDGTGIGLALCRKIVELHNGKIWVESIPHKGSEFYFTIRM